jgi:hypothetical protein
MIYIPSFIKIGSAIQKIIRGYTDTQTHKHTKRLSHKPTDAFGECRYKLETTKKINGLDLSHIMPIASIYLKMGTH